MKTAVDTNILIDVIIDAAPYVERSIAALQQATAEGSLLVCECVVAEMATLLSEREFKEFFTEWNLLFVPSTIESALTAGISHHHYLKRAKKSSRILADFLIGAHAMHHAHRLLTRDRGFYRDYFSKLTLLEP